MKGHTTCKPAAAELTVAQSGHIPVVAVVAYPQVPPGLARAGRDSADCTAEPRTDGIATRIRTRPAQGRPNVRMWHTVCCGKVSDI